MYIESLCDVDFSCDQAALRNPFRPSVCPFVRPSVCLTFLLQCPYQGQGQMSKVKVTEAMTHIAVSGQ